MELTAYILLIINAMLVSNVVFARFLGICPYLGVSKRIKTALGMSLAVIFVMTLASAATWPIQHLILIPLHLEFLQTLSFILVIASLVQLVELVLKKINPILYRALGIYLPLITTNCAILGVALIIVQKNYTFLEALVFGFGSSLGFSIALLIFSGIRERLELASLPASFRGAAIGLITAGLLALAFMGFTGLVK